MLYARRFKNYLEKSQVDFVKYAWNDPPFFCLAPYWNDISCRYFEKIKISRFREILTADSTGLKVLPDFIYTDAEKIWGFGWCLLLAQTVHYQHHQMENYSYPIHWLYTSFNLTSLLLASWSEGQSCVWTPRQSLRRAYPLGSNLPRGPRESFPDNVVYFACIHRNAYRWELKDLQVVGLLSFRQKGIENWP